MSSAGRIPKEEMHFQPLEDIAENTEEPGTRHPNMALFNRLLNAAPSPTSLMGGAFRRASAQIQRLRPSPSFDPCTSDDEEEEEEEEEKSCMIGKGGSLPSGLGQDTQSTVCSFREEKSTRTPLLDIQFGEEEQGESKGAERSDEEEQMNGGEEGETSTAPVSLLRPPPQPARETAARPASRRPSASLFPPVTPYSLEHCSSQPAISHHRLLATIPKPPHGGTKKSLLAVPCHNEPQRFRSVSMGSEFTGSSDVPTGF